MVCEERSKSFQASGALLPNVTKNEEDGLSEKSLTICDPTLVNTKAFEALWGSWEEAPKKALNGLMP